eukprot:TRINITY_DN14374_c0_g1_i1.p1 TRINITY_DN14374_c0_g1~~TRINITY_DN14374_c0_g1_i1.p1  ORF type:complete len:270 (+),score=57.12 TRINITY_DN14374_c0_g1_i1:49-858(+)
MASFLGDLRRRVTESTVLDGIPLAAQGKSLMQIASGDLEGAKRTQDSFTKRCLGVSQIRSALEHVSGNEEASRATQAEFERGLSDTNRAMEEAAAKFAKPLEHLERAVRPLGQQVQNSDLAARAGQVLRMAEEVIEPVAQRVEGRLQQGAAALGESEWGKRFTELLRQRHGGYASSAPRCSASSSSSSSSHGGAGAGNLNRYTILAEVSESQSGQECSCCLEVLQHGESIRVLPCFHYLHSQCAEKWLRQQPLCPVCRCDIATSLEAHG